MNKLLMLMVLVVPCVNAMTTSKYVEVMTEQQYVNSGMGAPDNKAIMAEEAQKGYSENHHNNAKVIIETINGKFDKSAFGVLKNNFDTHMKATVSDIDLTFKYKSIGSIINSKTVGYGASGTTIDGKWTGITEYINVPDVGACEIMTLDMKANKGKMYARDTDISYVVNDMPTLAFVDGSHDTGYSYHVTWFNGDLSHLVECASMKFEKDKLSKVIDLAKKIDKSLNS